MAVHLRWFAILHLTKSEFLIEFANNGVLKVFPLGRRTTKTMGKSYDLQVILASPEASGELIAGSNEQGLPTTTRENFVCQ